MENEKIYQKKFDKDIDDTSQIITSKLLKNSENKQNSIVQAGVTEAKKKRESKLKSKLAMLKQQNDAE